jgi:hypothetical protein
MSSRSVITHSLWSSLWVSSLPTAQRLAPRLLQSRSTATVNGVGGGGGLGRCETRQQPVGTNSEVRV